MKDAGFKVITVSVVNDMRKTIMFNAFIHHDFQTFSTDSAPTSHQRYGTNGDKEFWHIRILEALDSRK